LTLPKNISYFFPNNTSTFIIPSTHNGSLPLPYQTQTCCSRRPQLSGDTAVLVGSPW